MNVRKTISNMKQSGSQLAGAALAFLGTWLSTAAYAVNDLPGGPAVHQFNLHPPASKIAEQQNWLHWYMMIICLVIFVAVFGVMFYSIWKHRKAAGHKAANFHESTAVEIAWTVVPFLIVIAMALPATKVVVAQKDTTSADLTIKATGQQWKWGYDYVKGEGEGIGFLSTLDNAHRILSNNGGPKAGEALDNYLLKVDNPLVVPVGKKIRVITTANDVIHAFAVPSMGIHHFMVNAPKFAAKSTPTCRFMSRWFLRPTTVTGWLVKTRKCLPRPMTRPKSGY